MCLGIWIVRSLYRSGSGMALAMEVSKFILDLVAVQVVGGTGRTM